MDSNGWELSRYSFLSEFNSSFTKERIGMSPIQLLGRLSTPSLDDTCQHWLFMYNVPITSASEISCLVILNFLESLVLFLNLPTACASYSCPFATSTRPPSTHSDTVHIRLASISPPTYHHDKHVIKDSPRLWTLNMAASPQGLLPGPPSSPEPCQTAQRTCSPPRQRGSPYSVRLETN